MMTSLRQRRRQMLEAEILDAARVREMEHFLALIESEADGQTPLQRLIFVLRKFMRVQEAKSMGTHSWTPELFQLICSREEGMACIHRIDAAIIALIQAGIAAGEIDPSLDPPTIASAFYALSNALLHTRFTRGGATHPAATEMLTRLFERGVRAPGIADSR
jgi:hypothetical protein